MPCDEYLSGMWSVTWNASVHSMTSSERINIGTFTNEWPGENLTVSAWL